MLTILLTFHSFFYCSFLLTIIVCDLLVKPGRLQSFHKCRESLVGVGLLFIRSDDYRDVMVMVITKDYLVSLVFIRLIVRIVTVSNYCDSDQKR